MSVRAKRPFAIGVETPYRSRMNERPTQSVGLAGDGDEVAAIQEVEAIFGVRLDYSDARNWRTAGDVYEALRKALPVHEAARADLWERFAEALARETGVDPKSISAESTLLLPESPLWARLAFASVPLIIGAAVWIGLAFL
jgi:hypothetical protein